MVWGRSGTQGDRWRHGQLFIKRSTRGKPLTVIFEGVRGTSYAGDIALDDIAFAKNGCPAPRKSVNLLLQNKNKTKQNKQLNKQTRCLAKFV